MRSILFWNDTQDYINTAFKFDRQNKVIRRCDVYLPQENMQTMAMWDMLRNLIHDKGVALHKSLMQEK